MKPPTAEKKYYLKVVSENVKNYSLDIFTNDYIAPVLPEEDFAEINSGNNTWETAYDLGVIDGSNGPLELNTLSLHSRGDIDFYKFTTTKESTYADKIAIFSENGLSNSGGVTIWTRSSTSPELVKSSIDWHHGPGTYANGGWASTRWKYTCLLYTSDAADE